MAVFQLPSSHWYVGQSSGEPLGWAKMPGCSPVFYYANGSIYAADAQEPTVTVWHMTGYPPGTRTAVRTLHQSQGVWPMKFGDHDWVWCLFDEQESRWQIMGGYEDHWRFTLLENLTACGSALAQLRLWTGAGWSSVGLMFVVYDSVGLRKIWEASSDSIPAGACGIAKYFADSEKWEIVTIGDCCPAESESDSPSES
jgi:hypothetical protein